MLYQTLAEHLETFLSRVQSGELNWPGFVARELTSFLDCGILAKGFARVHCTKCGVDALVAFSSLFRKIGTFPTSSRLATIGGMGDPR